MPEAGDLLPATATDEYIKGGVEAPTREKMPLC